MSVTFRDKITDFVTRVATTACRRRDNFQLTIGSWISVRSSSYEARGKFGKHERCVRVARGVAESNSNFLSALQTSQMLHISINAQLTHEPIVL